MKLKNINESRTAMLKTKAGNSIKSKDTDYVDISKLLKKNNIEHHWSAEPGVLLFKNDNDMESAKKILSPKWISEIRMKK